jgi:hypothetical protein
MDKFNLLCQTIRFQRTALQNSLAMISAVQEHGQKFFSHSPWLAGQGGDAWLFWTKIWSKNFTGLTDLVDRNLAAMERLTSSQGGAAATESAPPTPSQEAPPTAGQAAQQGNQEQPPAQDAAPPALASASAVMVVEPQAPNAPEPPGKKSENRSGRQKKPEAKEQE